MLFKSEASDVLTGMPDYKDELEHIITATINGIRLINVYCVNREAIDDSKFLYKQAWFAALYQFVSSQMQQYEKVMVLGDFNIAPIDIDVYGAAKWRDKILCTVDERYWFQHILVLG